MTHAEFVRWLQSEVENRRMSNSQMNDLLRQKTLFDTDASIARRESTGVIVGYVADVKLEDKSIHVLLHHAKSDFPQRMMYFEPIGFDLI